MELRKCPFCQNDAYPVERYFEQYGRPIKIKCSSCGATGPLKWKADDAIEAWNKCADETAVPELLEALEAALEWIDSVPSDTPLPVMPGFDRDWVEKIIWKIRRR